MKISEQEVRKEDIPQRDSVLFEIQRTKGKIAIVIKKGKLSKRKEWIDFRLAGVWRRYFPNRFIKQTLTWENWRGKEQILTRYLVRFNLYYSEALGIGKDMPEYDQALENQLLNEWHQQYKKAVGVVASILAALTRDRSIQFMLLVVGIVGIPFGMAFWPQFISTPSTIIHWVPRR
jgi:hypothetical protein